MGIEHIIRINRNARVSFTETELEENVNEEVQEHTNGAHDDGDGTSTETAE